MFYEEIRKGNKNKTSSFLHIILSIKDSLQHQIHVNGNLFGNKCCRCNEGSLYLLPKDTLSDYFINPGPAELGYTRHSTKGGLWVFRFVVLQTCMCSSLFGRVLSEASSRS